MSFSKNDLDKIKSKISIRSELEKKTKIIQKGKDYWCCCPFHSEKTPSCKINEDTESFYCFGCGAKGDIFTLYTDLYNYSFIDSVKELSQQAGIDINFDNSQKSKQDNILEQILDLACMWFENNLNNPSSELCNQYLKKRKLNEETIKKFRLGYSSNSTSTLYEFLKKKGFNDNILIESNVVKLDKNNKIRDYFYKRLIFPIMSIQGKVVGFGGRSLDNTNPKYINSPESNLFHKRNILYNLNLAKNSARKKNNILICEGYMDVISLYQNGLQSVVAPLGTALTEDQIELSWKYCSKPTIMFDGDVAGVRASYKSAVMALPLISSKKFLQFVMLPEDTDPDSYINNNSFENFVDILKKPKSLINFIFFQSSKAINLKNVDEKISYDLYLDELLEKIKDSKTKYFYRNELKSLFFEKIRNQRNKNNHTDKGLKKLSFSIQSKQLSSFIATAINHKSIRIKLYDDLLSSDLYEISQKKLIEEMKHEGNLKLSSKDLINKFMGGEYENLINYAVNSNIYQLFPYSNPKFDPQLAYDDVSKSLKNLNTRLSNLKKINTSLNRFVNNSNILNWSELQNINLEISNDE